MKPEIQIDDLTIAQVKEIIAMFPQPTSATCACHEEKTGIDNFAVGQTVIIRTYSAGVWCGILTQKAGNEVILKNARRMWRWWCKESISLSAIVNYGIDQSRSKIAPPVDAVWLVAIEIMPISGDPAKSVMEAPIVQAE